MKNYYNEKEAIEFLRISAQELYQETYEGGIEFKTDEKGVKYHWSDLATFKILRKREKQSSAKFGVRKAAKYLGITERELKSYTNLRWIKTKFQANRQKVYSETDLDKFVVKILAPISKIVEENR